MDRKYKITYSGKITGKTPNYILSLRAHLKGIFLKWNGMVRKNSTTCFIASARSLMILPSRYAIPDTGRHPEKDYQ